MMAQAQSLADLLGKALPKGYKLIIHHLSTAPTSCPAIFAASPDQAQEQTFRESHFLSISIDATTDEGYLQVFGLEVFIYTTKRLTTLFVSKADSTGYLHLLNLPPGTPSPIKTITTTFLRYLIDHRTRPGKRLVLSLFARAQNQYLFPGSIENTHKHVLDDRGLIKWWCRVTDPLLKDEVHGITGTRLEGQESKSKGSAYLRVPGYDPHETRTFFPRDSGASAINDRWKAADPLVDLAPPDLPERCLIPRFPDDPKARFLDTLDEELPDEDQPASQSLSQETLERVNNGRWRSIRSLDQFWEAMSYRQECSSGRLVGFLWAVFTPSEFQSLEEPSNRELGRSSVENSHEEEPAKHSEPNEVQAKENASKSEAEVMNLSEAYNWPEGGRGEIVVPQTEYDEINDLLMSLDYANQPIAVDSTSQWSECVAKKASLEIWGQTIIGDYVSPSLIKAVEPTNGTTNMLSAGLVRKKKRPIATALVETNQNAGGVIVADASPHKKQKTNGPDAASTPAVSQAEG